MSKSIRYSTEVQQRAVRMVLEHQHEYSSQWGAICSIAEKIGCNREMLRRWVRQQERDEGRTNGQSSTDCERVKELEWENCEFHRANEILRKASAYFAQAELDRRPQSW